MADACVGAALSTAGGEGGKKGKEGGMISLSPSAWGAIRPCEQPRYPQYGNILSPNAAVAVMDDESMDPPPCDNPICCCICVVVLLLLLLFCVNV